MALSGLLSSDLATREPAATFARTTTDARKWVGAQLVPDHASNGGRDDRPCLDHDRVAVLPRARRISGSCTYSGTPVSILGTSPSRDLRDITEFQGSKDVGNADADLIVDGCLIDIKASICPKIEAGYLRQLAGYLLLDYDDMLHINSVGIYMARQRLLLKWDVPEFIRQLTGEDEVMLSSLRQEFRAVCQSYNEQRRLQMREQSRHHLQ